MQASGADADLPWKAWQSSLNLEAELPGSTVEIVVQGAAVASLIAAHPTAKRLVEALRGGTGDVTVLACANALRAHHIDPSDLAEGIDVVPAGIARLVTRQREGWSYVRIG
ncbi:hypothetical protein BW730_05530 [Tessaracoccus aquimaris]|uniref:Uncharacterized protein n=1 Tax=Tessaracoccus aquimaris TaxID=1332264 RepID=A0A1Q2CSZ3_9ACTN|nr:hypothetical protein BW730_05530 [Tessaracoccus aquimaris]